MTNGARRRHERRGRRALRAQVAEVDEPSLKTRGNGLSGTLLAKWIDGSLILSNYLRYMGCVPSIPFSKYNVFSLGHLLLLLFTIVDLECVTVKSPYL